MSPLLPELFLDRVREFPASPAVISGRDVVTYAELERSARRIARTLRTRGVREESIVGVMTAPGPDMIAALLGIWLAGGCYLPLDSGDPPERLRRVIASARARIVLTDRERPVQEEPYLGADVALLEVAEAVGAATVPLPDTRTHSRRAAYMIFTSGSTGTPKGVVIEHEAIANRVRWAVRSLELTAADRVLQKTPLTFDPAGWEIFAPLSCGAPVTFGRPDAGRDPGELIRSVREQQATVVQVVPTMLRLLAAEPQLASCTSLRLVCSGGEALHAELCRRVLGRLDVAIWNTYGPTECAIDFMAARFEPAQQSGPVPIGRPIDNAWYRLAPPEAEPAGADPFHELYACGAGVGRGYHGDPALTAERFLPDPSGPPGARMFRTGDLVRTRSGEVLEFVGRADAQVKVNGVRIEPGEVEAALESHPGVVEAAVWAVSDPRAVRRLVACVVTSRDADANADGLARHLRDRLPPAVVPSLIMQVGALPRTTTGKVDRARLPEPVWASSSTPNRGAQSLTREEHVVLETWRQLLDAEEISLDDDFFRLGGHSLALIRLAARLSEAYGVELDFQDLHRATNARDQARLLAEAARAQKIHRLSAGARLPLSHAQERFWILDRMDPGSREYLLPILIWLPAAVAEETVELALSRLAERHEVLRTRYVMDSDGLSAVIEPTVAIPLRVAESTRAGLPGLVAEELTEGFTLSEPPLWRAALLRDGGPEQLLLLVCHHIICDGWSAGLIEQETNELVRAIEERREPELMDLPLRYVDAVAWQRSRLTDEVRAGELDFWRHALADLPPLDLPTVRGRNAHRSIEGGGVSFDIPKDVIEPLLEAGRQAGASPYATFMTLWTVLLSRTGGQWDFGVGSPHAGRSRQELHDLVGPFINVVVVRSRLTQDMTFAEALVRVGQTCKEAFAHHAVPFEAVAEAVAPARDLSRTPLFQTMVTVAGDDSVSARPRERDLELLRHAWSMARTDLTLTLWPYDDGRYGGILEYASALFSKVTGASLAEGLRTLAERFAADPDSRVGTAAPGEDGLDDVRSKAQPHEETILQFVRDLLEQEHFRPEENIMEHGANSLKAARLLWKVQETFGVVVPMQTFFDQPTAAGLARVVEELVRSELDDGPQECQEGSV